MNDIDLAPLAAWLNGIVRAAVAEALSERTAAPEPATVQREWMNTRQAAEYLGCSAERLEIWRHAGGGPKYHKPSKGIVRYRRLDLDAYMATTARRNTSEEPATPRRPRRAAQ